MQAADLTQEAMATRLGVSCVYVRHRLSPLEEHTDHDWHVRDVLGMPEEAIRIFRDELNEILGEESRPIADAGDGALLRAVVAGLHDAAFVLRAATEDELLEGVEADEVREASLELMTLLGALAHRCGSKSGSGTK